jgi:putative FmdB family regulatory protein
LPTYEYACTACGHRLEAVQKFSDDPLTECPECGGALRKVYGAVGIVLKGSGFYKTDSRAAAGAANGKSKGSESSNGDGGGGSGSDSSQKSEKSDKPAASTAGTGSGSEKGSGSGTGTGST